VSEPKKRKAIRNPVARHMREFKREKEGYAKHRKQELDE